MTEPTHAFIAQRIVLVKREGDKVLVRFPDGSEGWFSLNEEALVSVKVIDRYKLK